MTTVKHEQLSFNFNEAQELKGKPYYKTAESAHEAIAGLKVKVYFNLHQHVFSITHKGKVIGYADELTLTNAFTTVNEKGRQRVLANKRKEVHAYVHGTVGAPSGLELPRALYYNPYQVSQFVDYDTRQEVGTVPEVLLKNKRMTYRG